MITRQHKWLLWSEILLAWFALFTLFFFTYLELAAAPYIGFNFNPANGAVTAIYANLSTYDLKAGDKLVVVNELAFADWLGNAHLPLFTNISPTEPLRLQIQAKGKEVVDSVQWVVPGFNWTEFSARLSNSWWLGYLFWVVGLFTLLLVRPLDAKRRLLAALFLLTALWLTVGSVSRWGLAESRVVYRIALLVSAPVLLHLHWIYPRSLSTLLPATLAARSREIAWIAYAVTAIVVVMQMLNRIPSSTGVLAFALALLGSLCLLVVHYVRQPDVRAHIRLLLFALIFAMIPLVGLAFLHLFRTPMSGANFVLLALPIIPGAYFYSIYRFQLGGSEFRANRLIAAYLFLILLATIIPIATVLLGGPQEVRGQFTLVYIIAGILVSLITLYGFPPFQRLVEHRLLSMPLPPVQLIDTYLERITITLSEPSLIHLLKDEVLPSLLVRQSALLRIRNNEAAEIYSTQREGVTPAIVAELVAHLKENSVYRFSVTNPLSEPTWVRLGLALQVEGKLIGLWLLGRHDPDDLYSSAEIATLQTLARQSALALTNIDQSTQLQALYQASIDRQEDERMKMAHQLHDAILNQAAVLYMSLDEAALTPRVENAYASLKAQIHQMVSNLRPPSLDLGLNAALEELAEELDQREQSKLALHVSTEATAVHYPTQVENHVFRIVQQACENAFRHGRAPLIQISGTLAPNHVDLTVEDNGVGFVVSKPLDMTNLLAHKHFGLVHMVERAEHIHADLDLDSAPGRGTRVRIVWSGNATTDKVMKDKVMKDKVVNEAASGAIGD